MVCPGREVELAGGAGDQQAVVAVIPVGEAMLVAAPFLVEVVGSVCLRCDSRRVEITQLRSSPFASCSAGPQRSPGWLQQRTEVPVSWAFTR